LSPRLTPNNDSLWTHGPGDILLMRLTFVEVRAMVSPARDVSKFRLPIFARADSPAFKSGGRTCSCAKRVA
jgi:hypothetical protein